MTAPFPKRETLYRQLARSACVCLALLCCRGQAQPRDVRGQDRAARQAVQSAMVDTQASAVVLRWNDGAMLASVGGDAAATPGSTVKPLLLSWALQHGVIRADTAVYCRRALRVGAQSLPCTHPPDQTVFTAESALAESCNTYFAELGLRMRDSDLEQALRASHLRHTDATQDTPEERERTLLGIRGVTVTPLELARAYRDLLLREDARGAVVRGLADSVQFGMADPARVAGLGLLGKTGTASDARTGRSHGWFAGALPGRFLVVVYLPHGDGGAAAGLAGKMFRTLAGLK